MSNEISLEQFTLDVMGYNDKSNGKAIDSVEDLDFSAKEMVSSIETLKTFGTYELLNQCNTKAKVNMLKKIRKIYNNSSISNLKAANSLESFYNNEFSTEEEKQNNKAKNFFINLWKSIKKIFSKIFTFFKDVYTKIKNWIVGLFNKKEANNEEADYVEVKKTTSKEEIISRYTAAVGAVALQIGNILESCGVEVGKKAVEYGHRFEKFVGSVQVKYGDFKAERDKAKGEKIFNKLEREEQKAAAKAAKEEENARKKAETAAYREKEKELKQTFGNSTKDEKNWIH